MDRAPTEPARILYANASVARTKASVFSASNAECPEAGNLVEGGGFDGTGIVRSGFGGG